MSLTNRKALLNISKEDEGGGADPYDPLHCGSSRSGAAPARGRYSVSTMLKFGQFELRSAQRALVMNGVPVRLGGRAFDILLALVQRRERVVEFDELLDVVWPGLAVEENNLSVHISALRKVLGGSAITTVRGKGYRFTAIVQEVATSLAQRSEGALAWRAPCAVLAVRVPTESLADSSAAKPVVPPPEELKRLRAKVVAASADGFCLSFENLADAARAALGMQRRSHHSTDGSALAVWRATRIGLASVQHAEGNGEHLAEGRALACALADVAMPDEIVATADVAGEFVPGVDGDLEDLGDLDLTPNTVRAYRLLGLAPDVPAEPRIGRTDWLDVRPSIAVLPFDGLLVTDTEDMLGEAVAEDVIACLSRSREFSVVSNLSSRRLKRFGLAAGGLASCLASNYLLIGSYRLSAGRLSINARLQDTRHCTVVHAVQLDVSMQEAFDPALPLGFRIGQEISHAVFNHAVHQAKLRPVQELENYALLMGAIGLMHRAAIKEFDRARDMLEHLKLRPGCTGVACAWMAKWHVLRAVQGWSPDAQLDAQRALDFAARSLEEDSRDALALSICGLVHAYLRKDLKTAGLLYEEAIDANPSEPLAWLFTATRNAYLGRGSAAEEAGRRALQLSPIDPMKYFFDSLAATSALANSSWDWSVELCVRSIRLNRTHASTWRTLAFALVMLGRMDEARSAVQQLLAIEPGFTVQRFKERFPGRDGPLAEPWAYALKTAGLPA